MKKPTKANIDLWRRDIVAWAEDQFILPETGQPIVLQSHQKQILRLAFTPDINGRLPYSELVYSCPKKSGKTAIGALITLWFSLTQEPYNEIFCAANDEEQAQGRVFKDMARAIEANPYLAAACRVTQSRIEFLSTGTVITALASDYAGAAGSRHGLVVFDELWAYTSERSRRLWDELTPVPTRKNSIRLVTTYAGFEGESELLWGLYQRGLRGRRLDDDLPIYANAKLMMYWDHEPRMPWQTPDYYEEQRQSLRPNAYLRLHENQWTSGESSFVDMDWWDACVNPDHHPMVAGGYFPVWLGVDASVKHDSAAVVACTWDAQAKKVCMVFHRIFRPSPQDPLDLEDTLEATNRRILITDTQGVPVNRVILGKNGADPDDYGLWIYDENGDLILGASGLGVDVVGTNQLINGAVTDAKIGSLSANKITAGTIDANEIDVINLDADNIITGTLSADRIATNIAHVNRELTLGAGTTTQESLILFGTSASISKPADTEELVLSASGYVTLDVSFEDYAKVNIDGTVKTIATREFMNDSGNSDKLDGYHASDFASDTHDHDSRYVRNAGGDEYRIQEDPPGSGQLEVIKNGVSLGHVQLI